MTRAQAEIIIEYLLLAQYAINQAAGNEWRFLSSDIASAINEFDVADVKAVRERLTKIPHE